MGCAGNELGCAGSDLGAERSDTARERALAGLDGIRRRGAGERVDSGPERVRAAPAPAPAPAPAWPVEGESFDPSATDALASQVYADELELGGVFTASGAQPAPAENVPAEEAEPERWPTPDETPTFVQEAGSARAPGESSGISRTRAGAVFVHVTGF